MMLFSLLIPILLIAALAYAFGWWHPGQGTTFGSIESRQKPVDVLKERYARGEINRELYEEMRRDLE